MERGVAKNVCDAATFVPNGSKTPLWNALLVKATVFTFETIPFRQLDSHAVDNTNPFRWPVFHALDDSLNEVVSALAVTVDTASMGGVGRMSGHRG